MNECRNVGMQEGMNVSMYQCMNECMYVCIGILIIMDQMLSLKANGS